MNEPRIPNDPISRNRMDPSHSPAENSPINGEAFSSFMQKGQMPEEVGNRISPFDLAQGDLKMGNVTPSPQTLLTQLQLTQNTMANIQNHMAYPHLKMKTSQRYLVKNKLASAASNLSAVTQKAGGSLDGQNDDAAGAPSKGRENQELHPSKAGGPISQFLSYVTDGMNQIESIKSNIGALGAKGANLTAADFLFMQIKLAKAQQELEFTSAILAKSVEDIKSIMNIQI